MQPSEQIVDVRRDAEAREFLPAALEIVETPASPLGRTIALSLAAFFTIAIIWATVGHVDVKAIAQGRIVPEGGVKTIQPLEIGKVRTIHVRDGDRVREGDLLIELDPTESEVDVDQLQRELIETRVRLIRLRAYLRGIDGRSSEFEPPAEADPRVVRMHREQLSSDLLAHEAEMASLDADLARRAADIQAIKAEISKYQQLLPLLTEREVDVNRLLQQGHTPKPEWMRVKQDLIEAQEDLAISGHRLAEAEAGMQAAFKEQNRVVAVASREALSEMVEANRRNDEIVLALKKAAQREGLTRLTAPVDGVVQQLAVRTVGGVVTPAEPLMVVVPDDAPLEIEALVLNKDKGFVRAGQPAEVKVETFNFTKYGTIDGEVITLAQDAIEDERLGLVYPARIAMKENTVLVQGEPVALTSGMSVTVEVKTGDRRIIEFLLSPLLRAVDESLVER